MPVTIFTVTLLLILRCYGLFARKSLNQSIRVELNDDFREREIRAPNLSEEPAERRYEVSLSSELPHQQVVIEGLPGKSSDSAYGSNTSLVIDENTVVFPGLFLVLGIRHRKNIYVATKSNQPGHSGSIRVYLRIRLPVFEDCSTDMLSFHGSCYAASPVRQNVTAAMCSTRGDAQLASFSSMTELRDFITANDKKLNVFPYKRKLNLKQPVRLGMFRGDVKEPLLSVTRTGSGCVLHSVVKYKDFMANNETTGHCVSLRVLGSGTAVIEFNNCNCPMASLLSFPERASSESRVSNCHSDSMIYRISELDRPVADNNSMEVQSLGDNYTTGNNTTGNYPETQRSEGFDFRSPGFVSACIVIPAVLVAAIVASCYTMFRRNRQNVSNPVQHGGTEESEHMNPPVVPGGDETFCGRFCGSYRKRRVGV